MLKLYTIREHECHAKNEQNKKMQREEPERSFHVLNLVSVKVSKKLVIKLLQLLQRRRVA